MNAVREAADRRDLIPGKYLVNMKCYASYMERRNKKQRRDNWLYVIDLKMPERYHML